MRGRGRSFVLRELGRGRNVRAVKSLRLLGSVLLATALVGLTACGSSSSPSSEEPTDGGSKEEASTPDTGPEFPPDAAPVDTSAIPNLPAMTWQFVPIQGAMCRDGSATGIGVNVVPGSTKVMIFLEGGGACFNSITCSMNPKAFSEADFDACTGSGDAGGGSTICGAPSISGGGSGILNRNDPANPMADWSFVYVPFCTGDVHAGNKLNATVAGVAGTQQFVGYANMTRYLARIVPTFPSATKVLLTGISAGGFGAAANYVQTAKAFGSVPVYDLDDSGPTMESPYVSSCLQGQWAETWGFDKTILADCGSDCPDPKNYTVDAAIHVAKLYPHIPFGLVEDTGDEIITLFYGFGQNNCAGSIDPLSASTFTAGLLDARTKLAAYPNTGGFIFQGTDHTSLGLAAFDTRVAGSGDAATVKLSDWVATLVNDGTVTNVGP
jgi:hypothetical protein